MLTCWKNIYSHLWNATLKALYLVSSMGFLMCDESFLPRFILHIIELFDSHRVPPGSELAIGDNEWKTKEHTNELHQVNLEVCPKAHITHKMLFN